MDVQIGPTTVVIAHLGVGRDEADPAVEDGVLGTAADH
jgi:hypothetical protein